LTPQREKEREREKKRKRRKDRKIKIERKRQKRKKHWKTELYSSLGEELFIRGFQSDIFCPLPR